MKLILVDGSALLYRSHFAFKGRPLTTSHGETTSAAFGFVKALQHLREDEGAEGIVVAFDAKGPTFRHEMYPQYKAHRPPTPPELVEQIPRVRQLVRAMGLPLVEVEGYEADDTIATLAKRARERGDEVWIYSGDKDFIPLLRDGIGLLKPSARGGGDERLEVEDIRKNHGIDPPQYLDVLALMGDKADNIPGVPGVGEKTALKLVREFGGIEGLLEHLDDPRIRPALRKKIEDNRDLLELSRKLVTIDENAPVEIDWESCRVRPYPEEFVKLCRQLEFTSLVEQIEGAAEDAAKDGNGAGRRYVIIEDLAQLERVLEELQASGQPVSIDTETTSLRPLRAELVGVSFCAKPGRAYYLPVDASGGAEGKPEDARGEAVGDLFSKAEGTRAGRGLSWAEVKGLLRSFFERTAAGFLGQNLKYDQLVLDHHGAPLSKVVFDTMIASYLLDPGRRQHGLDTLAREVLGIGTISWKSLFEGQDGQDIRDLPLERLAEYASEDADIALRLSRVFLPQLEEAGLDRLLHEVEMPLSQVLMKMEKRGIRLDVEHLEALSQELRERLARLESECHELAGETFNLNSPKQLQAILFTKLHLKPVRRTATGYSTDVDVLTRLAREHPLPGLLLEYRQLSKLLSTYTESLPRLVNPQTGCVHTSYNQAVAATGRLSSTDPNLQNIPVRSAFGRRIREAFIPRKEGWVLLAADYSQVELRLMAHFAGDEAMLEAFRRGEDIHARTAAAVASVPLEEVDSEMRSRAKAINFGILYGMGARALAQQISVSTKEAREFIDQYFQRFPRVKEFIDATIEEARRELEVRTILGRRRRLPELESKSPQQRAFGERAAVNTVIQGSAADLIKVAMIRLDRRIEREGLPARMLLQVHDELVLELPEDRKEEVSRVVSEEMEGVFELKVPLVVDLSFGRNWAEAKS